MSLRLKNIKGNDGSSLPIVMLFSTIGLITVLTYLLSQVSLSRPALHSQNSFQALLNARSGIYKAYEQLCDTSKSLAIDTLKTMDPTDTSTWPVDFKDTSDNEFGSEPEQLTIFSNDSFGTCEITMTPQGSFYSLHSRGKYFKSERVVIAKLGSKIPALPDTVLLYYNNAPWDGKEPDGEVISTDIPPPDSATTILSKLLSQYQEQLQVDDTVMFDHPLTIQSQRELDNIPDTVKGHLIIDGIHFNLSLKQKKSITVLGDIQITGEVSIEEACFIAGGEIKLFDDCDLYNVTLFSNSRIFIGDHASYQGDALAYHSITIYGNAIVKDKSTIVVSGGASQKSGSDSLQYSIMISDDASVDATCMALRTPGSIKTDYNTFISGILWAKNTVCHRGKMQGLIRALRVIDCDDPGQLAPLDHSARDSTGGTIIQKNAIPGSLSPLENISDYPMPYFTGLPSIIDWKEY